jgi:hypothetical protein
VPISIGVVCASKLKRGRKGKIEEEGEKVSDGERGRPVCVHRKQKEM